MASGNLKNCLAIVLKYEGGWADHPRDPGGATMKGVTLKTYRQYKPGATKDDLRKISVAEVEKIYRVGYWDKTGCETLPHGVDLAVFDLAVNSGPKRALDYLKASDKGQVPSELVRAICARRMSFVRGLKTFDVFGKGWTRRITDIETLGVAMALARGLAKAKMMAQVPESKAPAAFGAMVGNGPAAVSAGGLAAGLSSVWFGTVTESYVTVAIVAVTVALAVFLGWRILKKIRELEARLK